MWKQRLHNHGIDEIERAIAIQLAAIATADAVPGEFVGEPAHQLFAVLGTIHAAAFVLLDVPADQPIAEREAEIDGASGLGGEVGVDAADGQDEVLEGQSGGLRRGFGLFLGHASV